MTDDVLLGSWGRTGNLVGLVAAIGGDTITLFDPGDRQMAEVARSAFEPLPAGAVTVEVTVDVPVPHGVGEDTLRRWVASLADPLLRDRARQALAEAGLDEGAVLPEVRLTVTPLAGSGAVCLCGARMPAPEGVALACTRCGRHAVSRPASTPG